jgi:hypothetical protein
MGTSPGCSGTQATPGLEMNKYGCAAKRAVLFFIPLQVLVGLTSSVLGWLTVFEHASGVHVIGGLGAIVGGSYFAALGSFRLQDP